MASFIVLWLLLQSMLSQLLLYSVLDRLRNDVLLPLYKVDELYEAYESKDSVVEKYLEEVKAGKSKTAPDALLPNQIVRCVNHWNFRQVAELQWKAMMEGIKKQGKINGKKYSTTAWL
ncbi:uncharacterized protein Pyn_18775 [Prunus yedoensis var. nudiflora]|uniref:DUF2828 domain-containing protein n=1 Tax=Prunus yedoensis var. nudiflora TaxID=2094558 RepID=A0A314ZJ18_PRUYE|nr:uncharacterized protein Pyn_18775 [Prunus yedoensis var. nudiflora]